MMRCNWKLASTLSVVAFVMLPLATARAEIFDYRTILLGDSGFGGPVSLAWNTTTGRLRVEVLVQGMPGPSLGDLEEFPLHIHGPAMSGDDADVILQLGEASNWDVAFEAEEGSGIDTVFDAALTDLEIMSLSCIDNADCLLVFQEALDDGTTYIDFHTMNPSGELRGQIVPVPEPAASALAAAALAALGLLGKVRRGC